MRESRTADRKFSFGKLQIAAIGFVILFSFVFILASAMLETILYLSFPVLAILLLYSMRKDLHGSVICTSGFVISLAPLAQAAITEFFLQDLSAFHGAYVYIELLSYACQDVILISNQPFKSASWKPKALLIAKIFHIFVCVSSPSL
jgi:4-hydroxybenzoate polyprenyltransferase